MSVSAHESLSVFVITLFLLFFAVTVVFVVVVAVFAAVVVKSFSTYKDVFCYPMGEIWSVPFRAPAGDPDSG